MSDYTYEESKAEDLALLNKAFDDAFEELKEFESIYDYDGFGTIESLKQDLVTKVGKFKLTAYTYDDHYYDRCGGEYGQILTLLSLMPESLFKEKMKEYALKQGEDKYCPMKFLWSISEEGILVKAETEYGGFLGETIDITHSKKEIFKKGEE